MAKFLFTQVQNIEMIVKGGKPSGGAVVATHAWMQSLNALGHEVYLLRSEEDERRILPEYEWVNTYKTYHSNKGIPVIRWVYYRFPKLFKVFKTLKPDYIINSIPGWSSYFMSLMCQKLNIHLIIRLANDNMLDERIKLTHSSFERYFISKAFQNCQFIMAQNDFQYQALRNKYPDKRILKISNPFVIDSKFQKCKIKPEGYIAWVANFRFQKNLQLLYKISVAMPNEKFLIVGEPLIPLDPESAEYSEKIRKLPNVTFAGMVSRNEILQVFQKAKFLLNTSRYEGFSNTFLEAMQTGTPILSTPNVNPDQIISKHGLGLLYQNPVDLEHVLRNLSDEEYAEFSKNCINYIRGNHDHLTLGRRFMDFLKEE
ncbi:glycosyltransferase family 4 protein [Aquiflexum lacus]|uniref:glycosyltransferase family 4 protein n=1 Tax=Aquiflexum lacus TaxID=2483805 RepID=UPI001894E9CB|nr:glycosyltransferase family 4 protein [Aquiflexum lacus]